MFSLDICLQSAGRQTRLMPGAGAHSRTTFRPGNIIQGTRSYQWCGSHPSTAWWTWGLGCLQWCITSSRCVGRPRSLLGDRKDLGWEWKAWLWAGIIYMGDFQGENFRVPTGHGKPRKLWNFDIFILYPRPENLETSFGDGKSWHFTSTKCFSLFLIYQLH